MKLKAIVSALLACAGTSAFAQGVIAPPAATTAQIIGQLCDTTRPDRSRHVFSIQGPTTEPNAQCFVHVMPRDHILGAGQLHEGNYRVTVSGGGGGGGGGLYNGTAGYRGYDAAPGTVLTNLTPGTYRLTIGAGGMGGAGCNGATRGEDGAPTGLSRADTGQVVAGFPRAEWYVRTYRSDNPMAQARPSRNISAIPVTSAVASASAGAGSFELRALGGQGGAGGPNCNAGAPGAHGFIAIEPA
jgi:hypothetical protein